MRENDKQKVTQANRGRSVYNDYCRIIAYIWYMEAIVTLENLKLQSKLEIHDERKSDISKQ